MNNYERIKSMTIDEMAEFVIATQLKVMHEIKQTLVFCLPFPDDEKIEQMINETKDALESEVKE